MCIYIYVFPAVKKHVQPTSQSVNLYKPPIFSPVQGEASVDDGHFDAYASNLIFRFWLTVDIELLRGHPEPTFTSMIIKRSSPCRSYHITLILLPNWFCPSIRGKSNVLGLFEIPRPFKYTKNMFKVLFKNGITT